MAGETVLREPPSSYRVGMLRYAARPFSEIGHIARLCADEGIAVCYFSYRDLAVGATRARGFLFRDGAWVEGEYELPVVIDNAPPTSASQLRLWQDLKQRARLTTPLLGGKRAVLRILGTDPRTLALLLPYGSVEPRDLLEHLRDGAMVLKPYVGSRGRGIFVAERVDGGIRLASDAGVELLDEAAFLARAEQFKARGYMMQEYFASRTQAGPFDVRVPLFRGAGGRWTAAAMYVRASGNRVTSNLATGGQQHDPRTFLATQYSRTQVHDLMVRLEEAAYRVAEVLSARHGEALDALGCDFGIQDGELRLFEANSYPGLKGCLETAAPIKLDYYKYLLGIETGPAIEAATPENRETLRSIMREGANTYVNSYYLAPRAGNPIYRMLRVEGERRGLSFSMAGNTHVELSAGEGPPCVFSPNSPDVSVALRAITLNKAATKKVLAGAGIPVPEGRVFDDFDAALAYFRSRVGVAPQVVKPLKGSGGKGVTANVATEEDFRYAWHAARGKSKVVEDFVVGDEVRIFVVEGRVAAAVCRLPAHVIGDGRSTIAQLIARKNEARKRNPVFRLYPIEALDYLHRIDRRPLDAVPAAGEYVRLGTTSNVGQGGESVAVLDVLHPSILRMAEACWRALPGAIQVGLDVIIRDFRADAGDGNAWVIEVNSDPAVATPCFPAYGRPAADLPACLAEVAVARLRANREMLAEAPTIRPARLYRSPCDGASLARDYSLQRVLLKQAAYARNLECTSVNAVVTIISAGEARLGFAHGMPHLTSHVARRATNDKSWTKRLLAAAGISTPEGRVFPIDKAEEAWKYARRLGRPVVVKPLVGSGGLGVTSDIRTREHFDAAWQMARDVRASEVIVEGYWTGNDYRVFVIGNAICTVTQRVPAYLTGDGIHTIDELVELKNQARQHNPFLGAKPIVLTPMMRRNLAAQGLSGDSRPAAGQHVPLHSIANIGSGGESRDVTDAVHPDWAPIAVRARQAVFNPFHAGLDLIAEDISRSPHEQAWTIIEVNTNNEFGLQHFPLEGPARDVAGALLEAYFPQLRPDERQERAVRVVVEGRTRGADFRRWAWKQASVHGMRGWVRHTDDGRLEAELAGAPHAVSHLLELIAKRLPSAQARGVSVEPIARIDADDVQLR